MQRNAPIAGPRLGLSAPVILPWTALPQARVVDVGPPEGSAFELPGPKTRPMRPHLELSASYSGVAARVVQGDGIAVALAVLGEPAITPVAIGEGALGVSARSDGVWVLYRDRLEARSREGAVRHKLDVSGVALVGGVDGAVWVAGQSAAWRIGADGAMRGPFAWRSPLTSFAVGDDLCVRAPSAPREISCLSAKDGAPSTITLAFELAPLEQPISIEDDRVMTLQGATVRARRGAELVGEWTIQAAGVDDAGGSFAVTAQSGVRTVWRQGGDARTLAATSPDPVSAAALDKASAMLYGYGQAVAYSMITDAAPETATIDEQRYRNDIFPRSWSLSPVRGITAAGGALILAATGPRGVALLRATPSL